MFLATATNVFKKFNAVMALLYDLGVVIVDDLISPLTPQPEFALVNGPGFKVNRNGDTIYQGTQKAIEDFLNKIEDISKSGGDAKEKVQKYLDEASNVVKRKTRKATQKDVDELAKIRKKLYVGWNSNVAFTKGKIGDDIIDLQSRSGKPKGTLENWDNFDTIEPEKYYYKNGPLNRLYDSEQKQIEYLYNRFKNNKNIIGKIEIVSDLIICPNCNYIIDKFIKDFPNIEVTIVWVRKELKP